MFARKTHRETVRTETARRGTARRGTFCKKTGCRHLFFESLEIRRLLAAQPVPGEDGVLEIHGTDAAESIIGEVVGGQLCFTIDEGPTVCFPNEQVEEIRIFGKGGDDHIELKPNVEQRALLDGGADNDSVIAGSGVTTLVGAGGDDELHGGRQGDQIRGGGGDDSISGNGGGDTLKN